MYITRARRLVFGRKMSSTAAVHIETETSLYNITFETGKMHIGLTFTTSSRTGMWLPATARYPVALLPRTRPYSF